MKTAEEILEIIDKKIAELEEKAKYLYHETIIINDTIKKLKQIRKEIL